VFFGVFRVLTALSIYEFLWLRWNGLPSTCSTCEPPARTCSICYEFSLNIQIIDLQQCYINIFHLTPTMFMQSYCLVSFVHNENTDKCIIYIYKINELKWYHWTIRNINMTFDNKYVKINSLKIMSLAICRNCLYISTCNLMIHIKHLNIQIQFS
jgi:hypothetical protein